MTEPTLPPLPEPSYDSEVDDAPLTDHYSADQMREYARAALSFGVDRRDGKTYAACHQCDDCNHIGINDEAAPEDGKCRHCGWRGPYPNDDTCPECGKDSCIESVCPQCGGCYVLLVEDRIEIEALQSVSALAPREAQTIPPGFALVPDWKGYALLGTGRYCIDHTAAPPDPELGAELIIRLAKPEDVAGGRKVGEERDTDGKPIQPEDMAIRIGFLNVEALDALESQLEHLRRENFPVLPHVDRAWADEPTPKPQEGTWTLTAPDGRQWTAESPLRVCAAESRERVPAHVALARIARGCDEDAAPASPLSGWQPIESAPKDGRELWLFEAGDDPEQFVGYWCDELGGFWQYTEQLVADVAGQATPTHWMPLPSAPSVNKE